MEGDGQKKTGTCYMYVTLDKTLTVLSYLITFLWKQNDMPLGPFLNALL